jgi:hypothetical protein
LINHVLSSPFASKGTNVTHYLQSCHRGNLLIAKLLSELKFPCLQLLKRVEIESYVQFYMLGAFRVFQRTEKYFIGTHKNCDGRATTRATVIPKPASTKTTGIGEGPVDGGRWTVDGGRNSYSHNLVVSCGSKI